MKQNYLHLKQQGNQISDIMQPTLNNELRHSSSQSNIRSATTYSTVSRMSTQQQQYLQQPALQKIFPKQIQAQSSSSVDLKKDQLIMKLLMMSIEIQRKDTVVKNLLKQLEMLEKKSIVHNGHSVELVSVREELTHTKRYVQQLEYKLTQLTLTNNELTNTTKISTIVSTTNKQLEEKVSFLQRRNKQLEIIRIELESQLQKLNTQNKMLNYKVVNVESTEKSKLRQTQNMIFELQKKLNQQKIINNQLKIIIQSSHEEIRVLKQTEQKLIQQFNQKIQQIQKDYSHQEDLKRSQAVNTQQKIQMTQQELIRMQEEVKYWRKRGEQIQAVYQKKEQDMMGQIKRLRALQAECISLRQQLDIYKTQIQQKSQQLSVTVQQLKRWQFQVSRSQEELRKVQEESRRSQEELRRVENQVRRSEQSLIILEQQSIRTQQQNNKLLQQLNRSQQKYTEIEQKQQLYNVQIQQTYEHQLLNLKQQIQSYQCRLVQNSSEIQRLKTQNRKLKRQTSTITNDCPSCKVLQSATTIKSHTKLFASELNLTEIIQQTEKLRDGTVKIEHILSASSPHNRRTNNMISNGYGQSRMSIEERSFYQ